MIVRNKYVMQRIQKELNLTNEQLEKFKIWSEFIPDQVLARRFVYLDLKQGASLEKIRIRYGVSHKSARWVRAKIKAGLPKRADV